MIQKSFSYFLVIEITCNDKKEIREIPIKENLPFKWDITFLEIKEKIKIKEKYLRRKK